MHANAVAVPPRVTAPKPSPRASRPETNAAGAEIHAYAAVRDLLLDEAEKSTSEENLGRATIANDSVEACLLPLCPPYGAQFLDEADATRERKRCLAARGRIAELRRKISPA